MSQPLQYPDNVQIDQNYKDFIGLTKLKIVVCAVPGTAPARHWSSSIYSAAETCLIRNPAERPTMDEVVELKLFEGTDWLSVYQRKYNSPLVLC